MVSSNPQKNESPWNRVTRILMNARAWPIWSWSSWAMARRCRASESESSEVSLPSWRRWVRTLAWASRSSSNAAIFWKCVIHVCGVVIRGRIRIVTVHRRRETVIFSALACTVSIFVQVSATVTGLGVGHTKAAHLTKQFAFETQGTWIPRIAGYQTRSRLSTRWFMIAVEVPAYSVKAFR